MTGKSCLRNIKKMEIKGGAYGRVKAGKMTKLLNVNRKKSFINITGNNFKTI